MNWIKIEDKIPELQDATVLVHFENGSMETVHIEDYFKEITTGLDEQGNQKYTKWYLVSTPKITHWIIPTPPKY